MDKINVSQIIEDLPFLKPVTKIFEDVSVSEIEISRPGLELTGYVEHFTKNRVQVMGTQEISYLVKHGLEEGRIENYLKLDIPLIVFSRNYCPTNSFLKLCEQNHITVCSSSHRSTKTQTLLYGYLEYALAQETQVHGVLLSVFGIGVLIQGQSGIGKSELALELINKGHFLVADDAVVVKKTDEETLIGSAPFLLRNRLEIRGVGIVDVQKLYGVTKVVKSKKVSLVIELKPMTGKEDRIGTELNSIEILDAKIPKIEIPVTVGRTISNLIEVAVANYELKKSYGYDSADAFVKDLNKLLIEGEK